jgi:hypothetical protein
LTGDLKPVPRTCIQDRTREGSVLLKSRRWKRHQYRSPIRSASIYLLILSNARMGCPVGAPTLYLPLVSSVADRSSSHQLDGKVRTPEFASHRGTPCRSVTPSRPGAVPCRRFQPSVDISTNASTRSHARPSCWCRNTPTFNDFAVWSSVPDLALRMH